MDQRSLVEGVKRGDQDAYAALVHGSIVRLDIAARLILRDPELARDAVQEALFRAWRDIRPCDSPVVHRVIDPELKTYAMICRKVRDVNGRAQLTTLNDIARSSSA